MRKIVRQSRCRASSQLQPSRVGPFPSVTTSGSVNVCSWCTCVVPQTLIGAPEYECSCTAGSVNSSVDSSSRMALKDSRLTVDTEPPVSISMESGLPFTVTVAYSGEVLPELTLYIR